MRRGGNGSVLVNNHEISGERADPVPRVPGFTYDPAAGGGTTNIEVDKDGNRVREYVSSPARTTTAPAAGRRGTPG